MKTSPNPLRNVHRLAWVTAGATLLLICIGGVVTSKGVGMSVPDWPTSYGYNMFLLPWDKWSQGGVFWEHSHRLKGTVVGALTMALAIWLGFSKVSGTLKKLGYAALAAVVLQGLLGGLRVVMDAQVVGNTTFGVLFGVCHAALAQLFFLLVGVVVLLTSGLWHRIQGWRPVASAEAAKLRTWVVIGTVAIFVQLLLGATMRHQHAGLAIPDFPLAYGNVLPDTSAEAILRYNQQRVSFGHLHDITAFQVWLQMAHRFVAYAITAWIVACFIRARRVLPVGHLLRKFAALWLGLIGLQVVLGAATIWSGKAADVATAHVAVGALSLVTGGLFAVLSFRLILCPESGSLRSPSAAIPSGVPNR